MRLKCNFARETWNINNVNMRHGMSIPNSIGNVLDPEKRCKSGDVDVQI